LREVSAVLVVGENPERAAHVAVGIARAESRRRHVALGDLVGDLAPLYAIAGGEDAFGLTDCLRQGLPLNDIARPAPDCASLFILPAGSPPASTAAVITHERWPRLVNGFAKAGALLILVAPLGAPGLGTLAAAMAGVVLVATPPAAAKDLRVLATVAEPHAAPPSGARGAPRARSLALAAGLAAGLAALLGVLGTGGWLARRRHAAARPAPIATPSAPRLTPAAAGAARGPAAPNSAVPNSAAPNSAAPAPSAANAVHLPDPVNPADSATVAPFAVEVMAANTLAGANSFLANNAAAVALSGATVSPVVVGGSASVCYKVVAGASHNRAGADSLLAAVRGERVVRSEEGRVVKVPYALVLADRVDPAEAARLVRSWRARGVGAYALVQGDGSVRLLAGAFETPAQAVPLASVLQAAGVAPVLAFRTGRAY
jgi:hypothetical protein